MSACRGSPPASRSSSIIAREAEAAPARGPDPWLRFALTFAVLAIISEVVYYAFALDSQLFQTYLGVVAQISGTILDQLTENIRVKGTVITGSLFSVEIAQGCLQIHGGIGFTWEHDLHLYLRRLTSDAALFGDPTWHRERLAAIHSKRSRANG